MEKQRSTTSQNVEIQAQRPFRLEPFLRASTYFNRVITLIRISWRFTCYLEGVCPYGSVASQATIAS
jgi:hypothetical protein